MRMNQTMKKVIKSLAENDVPLIKIAKSTNSQVMYLAGRYADSGIGRLQLTRTKASVPVIVNDTKYCVC